MQFPLYQTLLLLLYSLALGIFSGIVYDIIRFIRGILFVFIRVLTGKRDSVLYRIIQIILDLLYSFVYALLSVIFIFGANGGNIRWFILFFTALGFMLYVFLPGRVTGLIINKCSDIAVKAVLKVIGAIKRLVMPIARCLKGIVVKRTIYRNVYNEDD